MDEKAIKEQVGINMQKNYDSMWCFDSETNLVFGYTYDLTKKALIEEMNKLKSELLMCVDKPKPGCPEVTWNYAIAFNIRILEELIKRFSQLEK